MARFEAPTLEEAYAEAARAFSCSVTELNIEVVQNPSRGFLGFGRKPAIIEATCPAQERRRARRKGKGHEKRIVEEKRTAKERADETFEKEAGPVAKERNETPESEPESQYVPEASKKEPAAETCIETAESREQVRETKRILPDIEKDELFDNFYSETPDIHAVLPEIEEKINALFAHACFDIEPVKVAVFDDETVLVEFNGNDAALLIGKEGYRYKALAYMLYNWIHGTYGFKVRLEIAEFLRNQEEMIENYLKPVMERAEQQGRAQTKVLDGILVQIALQRLREAFPDKYVAVRTNREGGRYIIVNEFMEKR